MNMMNKVQLMAHLTTLGYSSQYIVSNIMKLHEIYLLGYNQALEAIE